MTPDERNLLTRFLSDLNQVKAGQKDDEAQRQIAQALSANPDAPYLLVQHAILADQALAAAQARIAELGDHLNRLPPPDAQRDQGGGFLGGLFGGGQRSDPRDYAAYPQGGRTGPQIGPWGGPQPRTVVPQTQPQQGGFFGGGAPAQPGGMGSFLRNAGTTAAGVAGGAFLFEGLSNLFGGHHGGGGFLGGQNFGGFPTENVTINEFGGGGGGQGFADNSGFDSPVDYDGDNGDPTGDDYS